MCGIEVEIGEVIWLLTNDTTIQTNTKTHRNRTKATIITTGKKTFFISFGGIRVESCQTNISHLAIWWNVLQISLFQTCFAALQQLLLPHVYDMSVRMYVSMQRIGNVSNPCVNTAHCTYECITLWQPSPFVFKLYFSQFTHTHSFYLFLPSNNRAHGWGSLFESCSIQINRVF